MWVEHSQSKLFGLQKSFMKPHQYLVTLTLNQNLSNQTKHTHMKFLQIGKLFFLGMMSKYKSMLQQKWKTLPSPKLNTNQLLK
jgi:hypothetical protein